ncbi:hypothetical protein ACFQI7_26680 [Paenibacillus allorhizosphaerae]|uniref:Uncharacterized protein n=1 Tax=Paenibacillus allorhizosphaerae TaxID=2849866 RepID=A0ABN7TP38_9BACL|nr:hypothetical protein [Paenibacillus allorhizosphaerae]CAG7649343.1 hypothetical protein PAECIP111802_04466 [Paenibacillus allorhizosphaerae]
MYIVSTFEQSIYLELVITAIEQKGISNKNIMAVPLEKRKKPRAMYDSLHRADGVSMIDLAAILGTCFMLLGTVYGFELAWGPIIWGIIGAVTGILVGYTSKWIWLKRKNFQSKPISAETVLIIHCNETEGDMLEQLLWEHLALGVSRIDGSPSS